jgi:undecaprenyl-diphosphatase
MLNTLAVYWQQVIKLLLLYTLDWMELWQILILGLVQALAEWLPLSSKTIDTVIYTQFFGGSLESVLPVLLCLHFGTLLAAAVYFRKEIAELAQRFLSSPNNIAMHANGKVGFLAAALAMTGVVGLPILAIELFVFPNLKADALLSVMGIGLIITGFLLSTQHKRQWRMVQSATWKDGLLTGAMQGLSALPGVSRAGSTTTALIWKGFDAESAFRLSFLLSIPTVFIMEVVLWIFQGGFAGIALFDGVALALSSFAFGYLTIGAILKIAYKINVSALAFIFGIAMLAVGLMGIG